MAQPVAPEPVTGPQVFLLYQQVSGHGAMQVQAEVGAMASRLDELGEPGAAQATREILDLARSLAWVWQAARDLDSGAGDIEGVAEAAAGWAQDRARQPAGTGEPR